MLGVPDTILPDIGKYILKHITKNKVDICGTETESAIKIGAVKQAHLYVLDVPTQRLPNHSIMCSIHLSSCENEWYPILN